MDCLQAIATRRSIRKFTEQEVSQEAIKKLLEAGLQAPTAGNLQPWQFIVVTDLAVKEAITASTFVGADPNGSSRQEWMLQAPLFIIICVDVQCSVERYGAMGREIALVDGAAAVENILLAAVALGLSSCWVSGYRLDELRKALNIPPSMHPVGVLPIGYSAVENGQAPPKRTISETVYYEQYGNQE